MKRTNKILALIMSVAMIIGVMSVITPVSVSAAKGVDIYLDELSMSSYIFHTGTGYSFTDTNTNKVYKGPFIGERFEHPGDRPFVGSTTIDSVHTIGGHEPLQGVVPHSDFTWDISAFTVKEALPFNAKVGKAGGGESWTSEFIVLIDGVQVWTSGVVSDLDGVITLPTITIPQGAQTLTLRTDRGAEDRFENGEYHWIDARITLPAGSVVTRMETEPFTFLGNGGSNAYKIGLHNNGTEQANFWDTSLNAWRVFTSQKTISGHQTPSGDDAHVTWDISGYGAGYFTVAVCGNSGDTRFDGHYSIIIDGETVTDLGVKKPSDGILRATVAVPAGAQTLTVNINNCDDYTCGDFTIADPIFVECDMPEPASTLPTLVASISDEQGGDKIDHLYLNAAISASETRDVGIIFSDTEDSCKHVSDNGSPLFIRVATEGHGRSAIGFIQSGCYGSSVITASNLGGEEGDSVLALYWQDMPTSYEVLYARVFAKNTDGTYEYGEITTVTLTDGAELLPLT